ncbi:hypothetical protein NP493_314g01008 [Ridgeia piscesae]|uniref:CCHC-type domain-containing protein n=1 Tax=Ridgeia piscesae TaxID=27915 RepID=A0AAD9L5Q2_RIDPI|nr:hypothetical protein NP493_314g01008 [Ridgeia piscesae]
MATCPKAARDTEQGAGICFKCGSTEHTVGQCRVRVPEGTFPYAKCFICGETGHLSKQCPDNPRGLYPKGGCCRVCGSVEHFKRDCPDLQCQQGIENITLTTLTATTSADDEPSLHMATTTPVRRTGPKIVKF